MEKLRIDQMSDLLVLALGILFFGVSLGMIEALGRLEKK
jgi:hypothetical protein